MELMGGLERFITYKIERTKMTFQHYMEIKHTSCVFPLVTDVLYHDSHEQNTVNCHRLRIFLPLNPVTLNLPIYRRLQKNDAVSKI
jgi:hypothetical protein